MAAVTHMIPLQKVIVFGGYAQMQIWSHLLERVSNNTSQHVAVWDTYQEGSRKSQTMKKRDVGLSHGANVPTLKRNWFC